MTPGGKVYVALFNARKVGLLDPAAHQFSERDIPGSLASVYASGEDAVVYTLPLEDAIEYMVFTSGHARWNIPTSGAWPQDLTPDPRGSGTLDLWFAERQAGKVALLSTSQIATTLPLISPAVTRLSPRSMELTPDVVRVTPSFHPGNPMLPPPIALVQRRTAGAITEWDVTGYAGGVYVEDLALAPDGTVWFTTSQGGLGSLEPGADTVLSYSLPPSVNALGVTVSPDLIVWFTDSSTPAIGFLDPTNGDVTLWRIPGGLQPLKIAVGAEGIWFIDREGDLVGFLDPAASEFVIYQLPRGSYPVDLLLADGGDVWIACERGNYVARLSPIPALGQPPVPAGSGAAILGYQVIQQGNTAVIQVLYSYDGSYGLPVFVGLYVLPDMQGFSYPPYRIDAPGTGTATIELSYSGQVPKRTEKLRLVIYLPGGTVIAEREVELDAVWYP